MKTKYTRIDLREIAKDLIKAYNKTHKDKIPMTETYFIEVMDHHTRLIVETPDKTDFISSVL